MIKRIKKSPIRSFPCDTPHRLTFMLNQRQWNQIKAWGLRREGVPTKAELLDELLFKPSLLIDRVAIIARRFGVSETINATVDFVEKNPQLQRMTDKQVKDWYAGF